MALKTCSYCIIWDMHWGFIIFSVLVLFLTILNREAIFFFFLLHGFTVCFVQEGLAWVHWLLQRLWCWLIPVSLSLLLACLCEQTPQPLNKPGLLCLATSCFYCVGGQQKISACDLILIYRQTVILLLCVCCVYITTSDFYKTKFYILCLI